MAKQQMKTSTTAHSLPPSLPPSLTYPTTEMKEAVVACATALAIIVFPVPGGPYISTPRGGSIPICL